MRVAYCSPLPPQSSGIADYSAELLPALAAEGLDIELYLPSGVRLLPELRERFPCRPLADLQRRSGEFQAVLYHLGNDPVFHEEIYLSALRLPGVAVLHEYMLHHLIRGLTVDRHQPEEYVAVMERCYGLGGNRAGRRLLDVGASLERWLYPLFEDLVDASRGLIVHNRTTRDRVLASRPGASIEIVPHHLCLHGLPHKDGDAQGLRSALGLPPDDYLVGTFGFLTESKRLNVLLAAFRQLRRRWPESRLLLVGDPTPCSDLHDMLAGEAGERVEVIGRVEMERFLQYMQVVDTVVNLRWPTGGETSGTMIRLLGVGASVIVSDAGWFAELPDDVAIKVPVDDGEVTTLAASLLTLAEAPELRQRLGKNARSYVENHHTLQGSARGYVAALKRMAGQPRLHRHPKKVLAHRASSKLLACAGAALADFGVKATEKKALSEIAGALRDLDVS